MKLVYLSELYNTGINNKELLLFRNPETQAVTHVTIRDSKTGNSVKVEIQVFDLLKELVGEK